MAYQMDWLVPDRVVYYKVEGDLELPEMDAVSKDLFARLEQSPSRVYIIANTIGLTDVPKNVPAVRTLTQPFLMHPRLEAFLLTSGNPIVNFLGTIVSQVIGARLMTFKTVDAAMEHIFKVEPELREQVVQSVLQ